MRWWLTLWILAGAAHATERLVVLEVETAAAVAPDLRAAWTDAVRRVAHSRLAPAVQVLRRPDIDALLAPDMQLSLADCDTDCAVSAGRRLGVDLVVTARLYQHDGVWRARVALSRTRDGRLLRHATGRGAQAETALAAASHDALQPLNPVEPLDPVERPKGQISRAVPVDHPGPPTLLITGNVPMQLRVNGQPAGTTPLRVPTTQRFLTIHAQADGHQPREFVVDAGPVSSTIELTLTSKTGTVDLELPELMGAARLWVDGQIVAFELPLQLSPGRHRVALESPCRAFDAVTVDVSMGSHTTLAPTWRWRCPRVQLTADRTVRVQLNGRWYRAPTITERIKPGTYTLHIGRRGPETEQLTVRPSARDLTVRIPTAPLDFGADLGFSYRRHLGGMAFLRFWNHAQSKRTLRWGGHMGIGLGIETNPDFDPALPDEQDQSHGVGGIFGGVSVGVPITGWLEWVSMGELALGGASDGPPGIIGVQSGLRVKFGHLAIEGGWGMAAHGLVDGWDDAHGFRLGIALTERSSGRRLGGRLSRQQVLEVFGGGLSESTTGAGGLRRWVDRADNRCGRSSCRTGPRRQLVCEVAAGRSRRCIAYRAPASLQMVYTYRHDRLCFHT